MNRDGLARQLRRGFLWSVRRMTADDTGLGCPLVRVNDLAGADTGMQREDREDQRQNPKPQPCSQRASPYSGS